MLAAMGRAGYMTFLVLLGVVVMSISCLAVFAKTGALTAEKGPLAPPAVARPAEAPLQAPAAPTDRAAVEATPTSVSSAAAPNVATKEPAQPPASGTVLAKAPVVGPEEQIAQRLDKEAVDGALKLKALGAAKTSQGDRSIMAIYVRLENVGTGMLHVEPTNFKILDRTNQRYKISQSSEATLSPVDIEARTQPNDPVKFSEFSVTFEIPKTAAGLALVYEASGGPNVKIPLPPEFGGGAAPAKP
jgi:hypothetical protein